MYSNRLGSHPISTPNLIIPLRPSKGKRNFYYVLKPLIRTWLLVSRGEAVKRLSRQTLS